MERERKERGGKRGERGWREGKETRIAKTAKKDEELKNTNSKAEVKGKEKRETVKLTE